MESGFFLWLTWFITKWEELWTLFDAKQQEEVLEERRLIETTVVSEMSQGIRQPETSQYGSNQEL